MGLREIKKERARRAILEAARDMFFNRGFDETTIEEIAEEAEVAVGTVYNYFDSKSTLILAITAEDTSRVLDDDFQIPESFTALESVKLYINTFMKNMSIYPKRLLRELMREAWYSDSCLRSGFVRQDLTLIDGLGRILLELAEKQKLKSGTDIEHASLAIYGIITTAIMWYAADEERTPEQMLESLEKMLEILFTGLVPERGIK
ncbi:MAG: TetR/AcrR family transcriptional regulator [Candidatus Aegiribacteria sp.]|nr:TetR/AcrR family transcriptional regulator [Candidatus Aegiribacteria sp.]